MQRRDFLKLTAAVGMASAVTALEPCGLFTASRPALPVTAAADGRCAQPYRADHPGGQNAVWRHECHYLGLQRVAAGPCAAVDAGEDRHGGYY